MIAVNLVGRIGNQLFEYAMAEALRQKRGKNEKIIFYDHGIRELNWENSLEMYQLPNVEYRHGKCPSDISTFIHKFIFFLFYKIFEKETYNGLIKKEKKYKRLLNKYGLILCQNGYIEGLYSSRRNIFVSGFFQSEKFFFEYKEEILHNLSVNISVKASEMAKVIKKRNTVCISIKVEHNVGSSLYDVCNNDYYVKGIKYIIDNVENPLFFICSDNVPYVLENLIDIKRNDCIYQDKDLPVTESLALMGLCKHFILSNTSFGWWAQYFSDFENKIVIAPSRWMRIDMPVDIYCSNWVLVDVEDYASQNVVD